jgi:hypothetical protein
MLLLAAILCSTFVIPTTSAHAITSQNAWNLCGASRSYGKTGNQQVYVIASAVSTNCSLTTCISYTDIGNVRRSECSAWGRTTGNVSRYAVKKSVFTRFDYYVQIKGITGTFNLYDQSVIYGPLNLV